MEYVYCIYYSVQFKKNANKTQFQAFIDSKSEVNVIHLIFAKQLGLSIKPKGIEVQKIDSMTLDTYERIVTVFSVTDKANQIRFFKEIFLLANISPKVVLRISFLTLNAVDVDFLDLELW